MGGITRHLIPLPGRTGKGVNPGASVLLRNREKPCPPAAPIDFPCTGGNQVGTSYTLSNGSITLEPSGLVVLNDTLYMASDNGYLASMDVSSGASLDQPWTQVHNFTNDSGYKGNTNSYDLESITVATGKLMIGVEGKSGSGSNLYDPHIFRYDTANEDTTSSIWDLSDVTLGSAGGMEAMTFVPSSACPPKTLNGNANPAYYGGDQYYGGYFFAAYQSKTGYAGVSVHGLQHQQVRVTLD